MKSKPSKQTRTIVWAVDPTQDVASTARMTQELKLWSKKLDCPVQPVSVFSTSLLNLPSEFALPDQDKIEEMARLSVMRYLKKNKANGFLPPYLMFVTRASTRGMAADLALYAERSGAILIFTSTRAKKTLNPFRLGGFAETLVATSKVPVLLLNPKAKISKNISSMLFATDFGRESKNALDRLAPWAKSFKSKLVVYNQIETPNLYPSDFGGAWQTPAYNVASLSKSIEKLRQRKANEWTESLAQEGVSSTASIQRQKKYLGTDILEEARKNKIDLIAMASLSGPISQTILGSVARDVLLQAKCPVIIFYRPTATRKKTFTKAKRSMATKDLNDLTIIPSQTENLR